MDPIDRRMLSFVTWHGQIPPEAKRVEDHEAHRHAATWLRRHIGGRGIVHSYVIGYVLAECWWTLFFERLVSTATDGAERWWVEAYDHNGKSWTGDYYYLPDGRWRTVEPEPNADCGPDNTQPEGAHRT